MLACEYLEKWTPLWGWHQLSYTVHVLLSQGYQQSLSLPDPEGLVHCRGWTAATSNRLTCFICRGCELL